MINALIQNQNGGTLVWEFPGQMYKLEHELQKIGIQQWSARIRLVDDEENPVNVKLYAEEEIGQHLIPLFSEEDSLEDVQNLTDALRNANPLIQEELRQRILDDRYSSKEDLYEDIWQMTYDVGTLTETFYFPLIGSTYPSILDGETYARLQAIKASRNTQKDYDRNAGIFRIKAPALCPSCGYKMRRTHDARRTDNTERWICQNPDCKRSMAKTDEDLIGEITELLNMTIADPGTIQIPVATDDLADSEIQKIDNEIDRMLNAGTPDKGTLRYAMLRRVSLAYANIPDEIYISKQLRADFANAKPLSSFSSDLFHKTVKAILFHEDGTVGILLINDQEIRKAKSNGKDRAAAESGTANPCDS